MTIAIIIIFGIIISFLIGDFRKEVKRNMLIVNKNVISLKKEIEQIKTGTIATSPKTVTTPPLPVVQPTTNKAAQKTNTNQNTPIKEVKETRQKIAIKKEKKPSEVLQKSKPIQTKKEKRDYEKLIGENWLNKIGITILVLGIGFFVKYAIDQNWIGLVGRVLIGIGIGATLIGLAHYLRKKYRSFSSVLIGGGISVFYFTITIAYQEYHLFSQTAAFIVLSCITLLATLLAILYDRKELAIIGLIGAFASPFMVSNGTGNYSFLFTYIIILNTGMLILSYFKKWRIISQLALAFTTLFFGTWLITDSILGRTQANLSAMFATIFFVQFISMNLLYNFKKKLKFTSWEFIQFTSITALYFGAVIFIMNQYTFLISPSGFSIILSLFFISLTGISMYRTGTDKALTNLMIGKAVTFTTLAGAFIFEGNYMTMFWAIEALVILALGKYRKMEILKNASVILNLITIIGFAKNIVMNSYAHGQSTNILSSPFITGLFVIASLIITLSLLRKEDTKVNLLKIQLKTYKYIIGITVFAIAYTTFLHELIHQLKDVNSENGKHLALWIFHLTFVLIGLLIGHIKRGVFHQQFFLFTGGVGLFLYLTVGRNTIYHILDNIAVSDISTITYMSHFILVGLAITTLIALRKKSFLLVTRNYTPYLHALLSIAGLIIMTIELDMIFGFYFRNQYELSTIFSHTETEGYTILWGVYSFALMLRGMKQNKQIMRILALVLFSATLIKLFAFDIQNISEAGKIVAFILLGILLLIISFMYQKLKQLIIGETQKTQ